jgi:hypothetical protein
MGLVGRAEKEEVKRNKRKDCNKKIDSFVRAHFDSFNTWGQA